VRVNFRCYGESAQLAERVYMHLHARLHGTHMEPVTVGAERIAFYRIGEDVSPAHLEEPDTGWPYVFVVYGLTVSTMAVA
jgi:hypothetical protein